MTGDQLLPGREKKSPESVTNMTGTGQLLSVSHLGLLSTEVELCRPRMGRSFYVDLVVKMTELIPFTSESCVPRGAGLSLAVYL